LVVFLSGSPGLQRNDFGQAIQLGKSFFNLLKTTGGEMYLCHSWLPNFLVTL